MTRLNLMPWLVAVAALRPMPSLAAEAQTMPSADTQPAATRPAADARPAVTTMPAPTTQPAATIPPVRLNPGFVDGMVMNFKDAPLEAVLREMSEKLGLVIIDGAKVLGRVTVVSSQPLSADEAVETLNAVLKSNGYTAIRTGRNLRIVPLEEARSSNVPVRSGSDPARMGQSDAMITQVIPIRYAEADRLRRDLEQLIPKYAHMTSNVASNTLIYTATEADARHVVEIVRALDVQMADADMVRVFQLEFADARSVARLVLEIFNQDSRGTSSSQQRGGFLFGPPGFTREGMFGGDRGRSERGGESDRAGAVRQQRVATAADEQTNSVVVSAAPEVMTIIADVVKQLDSNPTAEESIFVYPLTNAKAADLEPILQDIFDESTTRTSRTSTSSRQTTSSFRDRFTGGTGGSGGPGGPGGASGAAGASSDLAGKVYVVADEATNSLLVRTAPKYFDRVKAILKDLDRATRQVLIKVLIAEITHDHDLDLGAEFSVLNLSIGTGKGTIETDFGVAQLSSGLVAKYTSLDFQAALRALQQVGKLDVLSRPYLLGSENQEATITVGEEVPFITNSRVTDAGQTINTVEYRDIGIILKVTPYIGPDRMVILDISQEISSTTGRSVIVSEDFAAEVYAKRSAQTRVAVANAQTVVIGGLMQDKITETIHKVPWLGDIPVVGAAFSRTQRKKSKTELLIFLCPQTAMLPDELSAFTDRAKSSADLVRKAVVKGAFDKSLDEMVPATQPATQPSSGRPQAGAETSIFAPPSPGPPAGTKEGPR